MVGVLPPARPVGGRVLEEKAAVAGLTWVARVGGKPANPIDRYAYPAQEAEVGEDELLYLTDGAKIGTVAALDRAARTLDVKKRAARAETHPVAVFAHTIVDTAVLAGSLHRIAEDVAQGGRGFGAARALLARAPLEETAGPDESAGDFAVRIAGEPLLALQGPPGAGKTHTAARMIGALVRAGKRVGVTAMSHKVIRNLLEQLDVPTAHKVSAKAKQPGSRITEVVDNADALAAIDEGKVVGGTQWLWAREEAVGALDVLFVDEAGQMSLANVLAASPAARSLVLLGTPSSSSNRKRGRTPTARNAPRSSTSSGSTRPCPPIAASFSPRPATGAAIAAFTSESSTRGACGRDRSSRARRWSSADAGAARGCR